MTPPSWPADRPLRAWQQAAAAALFSHEGDAFLASATPAAGKTTFGLHVAHRMLSEGRVARVAVVAPTTHIARQWAADAARYGLDLEPNRPNAAGPEPRDRDGVAVTYQTVAAGPAVHRAPLRRGADAADRRRAAPHGRAGGLGAEHRRGLRARPLPAAALGHAVPDRRHADPVGPLRRGRPVGGRLRLRLHRRAARPRLPPGHVPPDRRRHGVGVRRAPPRRRLRRRARRRRGRPPAAHGARPRRRLDRARPARRRPAARARPRRRPSRRGRAGDRGRQGARRGARRPARADRRRAARDRDERRAGRLGADRPLRGGERVLARVGADGLRGRRHPAPARRRLRHERRGPSCSSARSSAASSAARPRRRTR